MTVGQPSSTERDERILSHIGRYRIAFRTTLEQIFFEGRSSGNVVQRLLRQGRIVARPGLGPRLRYYQLSAAESARQGVPLIRAKPLGGQALQTHIGVLWYCYFTTPGVRRGRLEPSDLTPLFRDERPKGAHCVEPGKPSRVFRVIVTGDRSTDEVLLKRLKQRIARCRRHPVLGPMMAGSEYCFVILAENGPRRERLRKAITRRGLDRHARILVDYAPGVRSVHAELRGLQRRQTP